MYAGHFVGSAQESMPAAKIVDRMEAEYMAAGKKLAAEFS